VLRRGFGRTVLPEHGLFRNVLKNAPTLKKSFNMALHPLWHCVADERLDSARGNDRCVCGPCKRQINNLQAKCKANVYSKHTGYLIVDIYQMSVFLLVNWALPLGQS
jgi:hypothetical protein